MPPKPDRGIRKTDTGWRAYLRVKGRFRQKRFGPEATLTEMKVWRERTRAEIRDGATFPDQEPPASTFDDDCTAYLAAVKAMPTYDERKREIDLWRAQFGPRERSSITSAEIRAVLHAWKEGGRAKAKKGSTALSASAVNHRRTALMHLWSVLDGHGEPNPVKDVPKFREPDPQPRGLPYATVRRVLAALPRCATRARLEVMAYTGLPPSSLGRITPAHVDWTTPAVFVPGRQKGRGTRPRRMPLTPEGVKAFRELKRFGAWGPFSTSSVYKSFQLACGKLKPPLTGIRPYDLRHSFGSAVYAGSGDIRSTQVLMGHSTPSLTARYALAAQDPRVLTALQNSRSQMAKKRAKPKLRRRRIVASKPKPKRTRRNH